MAPTLRERVAGLALEEPVGSRAWNAEGASGAADDVIGGNARCRPLCAWSLCRALWKE